MYKITIKFNNGTEATYKTSFSRNNIESTALSTCPYTLFFRYSKSIPKAKELLKNLEYLNYCKDSVIKYFGATITSFEKIDGRSVESKALNYFTVEEALKNF